MIRSSMLAAAFLAAAVLVGCEAREDTDTTTPPPTTPTPSPTAESAASDLGAATQSVGDAASAATQPAAP